MSIVLVVVTVVVMLAGLVGTLAPLLPGLILIWAAGVGSWVLAGFEGPAWFAAALLTALLVGGTVAKYVLPGRSGRIRRVAGRSMAIGAALGVVGFFVIPLVGFVVGGLVGVFIAESARTGDRQAATDNTVAMLKSFGFGVLIEVAAGIAMIGAWFATVLVEGIQL